MPPKKLVEFEIAVVSFFVDGAEILGIPKSLAAIYGICFANSEPLSFAEIESKLDISKGSVSQGLRLLRDVGALREISRSESRTKHYEPDIELRKLMLQYLEQRVEQQLKVGKNRIQFIKATIQKNSQQNDIRLLSRIKTLEQWFVKSRAILPVIRIALKIT